MTAFSFWPNAAAPGPCHSRRRAGTPVLSRSADPRPDRDPGAWRAKRRLKLSLTAARGEVRSPRAVLSAATRLRDTGMPARACLCRCPFARADPTRVPGSARWSRIGHPRDRQRCVPRRSRSGVRLGGVADTRVTRRSGSLRHSASHGMAATTTRTARASRATRRLPPANRWIGTGVQAVHAPHLAIQST